MTSDPRLKRFNANPWNVRTGDCVIRALVLGLGFDYRAACRHLGVAFKKNHGLIRDTGIDLYDVKTKFSEFFDVVEDFEEDMNFVPDEFKGSEEDSAIQNLESNLEVPGTYGITLGEFIEMYRDQGCFLVGLVSNDKIQEGHIVFVNCNHGKNFAVDTFNSLDMLVDSFIRIKKTLPKDDPRHFKLDPITKKFII